jgi:hypothetical protein
MKPPSFKQADEMISVLLTFLTKCDPDNPDVDRMASALEPIVYWHQAYSSWKEKSAQPQVEVKPAKTKLKPKRLSAWEKYKQLMEGGGEQKPRHLRSCGREKQ